MAQEVKQVIHQSCVARTFSTALCWHARKSSGCTISHSGVGGKHSDSGRAENDRANSLHLLSQTHLPLITFCHMLKCPWARKALKRRPELLPNNQFTFTRQSEWKVCYLHFVHLHILLVLGKLEVRVIGRWSELVARQHKKDQSRHLHQKLKKQRSVLEELLRHVHQRECCSLST